MNNNGVASLEFVATLNEYRRKGLARTVCIAAIRDAFANGTKIITTRAFHPASLLYQSLGFKIYY
jgi:ribosomal protein S18 acetylase RimI-like enzyme